jgi:hypothetical protein
MTGGCGKMDEIISGCEYNINGLLHVCEVQGWAYQSDTRTSIIYDDEYFKERHRYEKTYIYKKIKQECIKLVDAFCEEQVLEVKIGDTNIMKKVRKSTYDGITFWDSLDRLQNPGEILWSVLLDVFVFVSIPIIKDLSEIQSTEHFKPNERYYYFTKDGLVYYFEQLNYNLIQIDELAETYLFVFQKK